jgi:PEP-CTERM motif
MKKLLITTSAMLGLATAMYGQGFTIDNGANTDPSTAATSGGLVFLGNNPIAQDFNLIVMGGSASDSLAPVATFLLSDSSANGLWSLAQVPGQFYDPTFGTYSITGVGAGGTAYFQLEAWVGTDATPPAGLTGTTTVFSQVVSNPGANPPTLPPDFTGMSALVIPVPEPASFALGGLGLLSLLLFRRRK